MTGKDLFESLSWIDERFIEEAAFCTPHRKFPWLRVASLAACLCLLLLCIRPLVNTPQATVPPTTHPLYMPEGYLEVIVHVQEMTDEGFTGTVAELVLPEPFALGMKLNVVFEGDTWYEMADGSGVTIVLERERIPLMDGARDLAEMGMIPGGAYRNREYAAAGVQVVGDIPRAMQDICYDPQTSGGLLIALPAEQAQACLAELQASIPNSAMIGYVTEREEFALCLE